MIRFIRYPSVMILAFLLMACQMIVVPSGEGGSMNEVAFTLDQPFALRYGQTATMQNGELHVTFTDLLEDSRCPKTVLCAWSGQARILITAGQGDAQPMQLELKSNTDVGSSRVAYAPYIIELIKLDPYPEDPSKPFAKESYAATLVTSKQ